MYNSIIGSIARLKLCLFSIFLAICGFHPKRTAPAWRQRMNQANFWYPVLMYTVFQWGRSASTGTNGSQKGQGLSYKAGGVKLPIHCFQIVPNRNSIMGPSVVMTENHTLLIPPNTEHYLRAMDIRLCRWFCWLAGFHIWFVVMDPLFIASNNRMQKWLLFVAFQQNFGHAKPPFNVFRLEFMWKTISFLLYVSGCF